jgi:hypothetical protein
VHRTEHDKPHANDARLDLRRRASSFRGHDPIRRGSYRVGLEARRFRGENRYCMSWIDKYRDREHARRKSVDLNLKLEYVTETEDEKVGGGTAISLNLIRRAIEHKYPSNGNGAKGEDTIRIVARIQKAIARARNDKTDALTLTIEQLEHVFDLLKNMRDTGGVGGGFAHHFYDLYESVEKAIGDEKKKPKAEAKG